MFCQNCGKEIYDGAVVCTFCGCATKNAYANQNNVNASNGDYSEKDWLVTLLLCLFLGGIGIHRFYAGKTGTGILWLLTLGCFGIGTLIDLIMILTGSFTDGNGKQIKNKK